jgi:hypothetical protein
MLTAFLAAWGAILSTFGLGWTLYRDLHDRARIRFDARVRRLGRGEDGRMFAVSPNLPVADASQQLFVCITVVNEGRRPILITTWGGQWIQPRNGKSSFVIYGRDLPKMLNEGQQYQDWSDELVSEVHNIKSLSVFDSVDKEWKLSENDLARLKEEARKFSQ